MVKITRSSPGSPQPEAAIAVEPDEPPLRPEIACKEHLLRADMTKNLRSAPDADNGFTEQHNSKQDKNYRGQWPRS